MLRFDHYALRLWRSKGVQRFNVSASVALGDSPAAAKELGRRLAGGAGTLLPIGQEGGLS